MMAYSGYRMWRRTLTLTHPALRLFYGQLFLNGLWSWVFFVWHWGALALINILILLLLIARLIQSARHIDDLSAFLLLPYALWVTFAAVLTWALWQLNPVSLAV